MRRSRLRAVGLPLVLGVVIALTVLIFAVQSVADRAYRRVSLQKHQEVSRWLAISGADYAEANLHRGHLGQGFLSWEASFQQGSFRVRAERTGAIWRVVSVGLAGPARFELVREVGP